MAQSIPDIDSPRSASLCHSLRSTRGKKADIPNTHRCGGLQDHQLLRTNDEMLLAIGAMHCTDKSNGNTMTGNSLKAQGKGVMHSVLTKVSLRNCWM